MDELEFRILDTLSRDPGRQMSISALARDIKRLHGTAYYSNTHKALHRLQKEGVVHLTKAGSSSQVSLDLRNRQTIGALSEMDLRKRHSLLSGREELQRLFDSLSDPPSIAPASLIDAERNAKLNRAELLIQIPGWISNARTKILGDSLREMEARLNIRIDALALDEKGFRSLLAAPDKNALKEMLSKQTALLGPDLFWSGIRNAWAHGIRIQFDRDETNPAKMSEQDLTYNLARFGFSEFGSPAKEGESIGIEYIVIAVLLKGDARRIQGIPVILAKNPANYALLLFLSKKYGIQGELLGLLRTLARYKESQDLRRALLVLEAAGVREVKVNETSVREMMRTYHADART